MHRSALTAALFELQGMAARASDLVDSAFTSWDESVRRDRLDEPHQPKTLPAGAMPRTDSWRSIASSRSRSTARTDRSLRSVMEELIDGTMEAMPSLTESKFEKRLSTLSDDDGFDDGRIPGVCG